MKKKILMIDIGGWGGIAHYTYNLVQALAASGSFDCSLLTDDKYELDDRARDFSMVKCALNGEPYIPMIRRLLRQVRSLKPDIIHVQTLSSARKDCLLFLLAKMSGAKIVFTAHNVLPHESKEKNAFGLSAAFRMIYSACSRIIVHSRFSQEKLVRLFGAAPEKIRIIPHGNYLFFRTREMSRQEARRSLGLTTDKKIIMLFGALREYKGIDVLLDAFKGVREKDSTAFLLIAGLPINFTMDLITHRVREYGLEEAVRVDARYIPFEQIAAYLFSADILAFPYKDIDMSGSLQLAYAFGKPVVCADSGGLPEVVTRDTNGILVKVNDSSALSEALLRLLADETLRKSMGEESLRLARENFSWEKIASSTAALYEELL